MKVRSNVRQVANFSTASVGLHIAERNREPGEALSQGGLRRPEASEDFTI